MQDGAMQQLQADWGTLDNLFEQVKHTLPVDALTNARVAFRRTGERINALVNQAAQAEEAMGQAREQLEAVTNELNALKAKECGCPGEDEPPQAQPQPAPLPDPEPVTAGAATPA